MANDPQPETVPLMVREFWLLDTHKLDNLNI
jgi:hypothetical protein